MELSGIVLQIFEEKQTGKFKERIIRVRSFVKNQIFDVYTYDKLAFRCGFLREGETVVFAIVLRGIMIQERRDAQVVATDLLYPKFQITNNHPILGEEFIRGTSDSGK